MDALLGSLAALAQAGVPYSSSDSARRLLMAALFIPFAAAAVAAAVGFGLAAIWFAALPYLGAAGTSLILAGILSILSGIFSAIVWTNVRRRQHRSESNVDGSLLAAAQIFKDHKEAMLLAALVAGLSAGAKPTSRANRKADSH
ncbi:hypothetical protein [Limibacillus sp. MBR-115]|jgi:cytochrome c biogenesis protein CcdA|uniref:hypothetical protein n=1 Tax=Limibacillus sp. MBR-115 TaxID=3156465 RepID=UPI0033938B2B